VLLSAGWKNPRDFFLVSHALIIGCGNDGTRKVDLVGWFCHP